MVLIGFLLLILSVTTELAVSTDSIEIRCKNVVIVSKLHVKWDCEVRSQIPNITCEFKYWKHQRGPSYTISTVTARAGSTGTNTSLCSLDRKDSKQTPVGFSIGDYTFNATAYPGESTKMDPVAVSKTTNIKMHGPKKVSASINKQVASYNHCATNSKVTLTCDVEGPFYPPNVTVHSIPNGTPIGTGDIQNNIIRHRFKVDISHMKEGSGPITMKCVAKSVIFPKIMTEGQINVKVPPTSSPHITIKNADSVSIYDSNTAHAKGGGDNVVAVPMGDVITIKCRVDGGRPKVSRVHISCGSSSHGSNSSGTQDTLKLDVHEGLKQNPCVCRASHVSGCYDKTSKIFFNVQTVPRILHFTVLGQLGNSAETVPQRHQVEEGDNVTLSCEATGNPRPRVSIDRLQPQHTPITVASRELVWERIGCWDTGEYVCSAENIVGASELKKVLNLDVKCGVHALVDEDIKNEFHIVVHEDLTTFIPIIGNPGPTNITLKMIAPNLNNAESERQVVGRDVDERRYDVIYKQEHAPKGTVIVRIPDLHVEDQGEYLVNINNGFGDGLDFRFNVTVTSAARNRPVKDQVQDEGSDLGDVGQTIGIGAGAGILVMILAFIIWKSVFTRLLVGKSQSRSVSKASNYDILARQEKIKDESYVAFEHDQSNIYNSIYCNEQSRVNLDVAQGECLTTPLLHKPPPPRVPYQKGATAQQEVMHTLVEDNEDHDDNNVTVGASTCDYGGGDEYVSISTAPPEPVEENGGILPTQEVLDEENYDPYTMMDKTPAEYAAWVHENGTHVTTRGTKNNGSLSNSLRHQMPTQSKIYATPDMVYDAVKADEYVEMCDLHSSVYYSSPVNITEPLLNRRSLVKSIYSNAHRMQRHSLYL